MSFLARGFLALLFASAAMPALAKQPDAAGCEAVLPKSIMATHTLPPYPRISVRLGESGATMVAVTIGTNGAPVSTAVSSSSGSARLDDAATTHIMQVWRWEKLPETCRQSVTTLVRVVWDLKAAPPEDGGDFGDVDRATVLAMMNVLVMDASDIPPGVIVDKPAFSMAMVMVPETGDLRVISRRGSGNPALDERALYLIKTRYRWMPARMDAKPIGSAVLVAVFWMPPGTPKLDPQALKALMGAFVSTDTPAATGKPVP